MGNDSKIFEKSGLVFTKDTNPYAYISISVGDAVSILRAPITGIKIRETVDFNILKTVAGNFNIVTFGQLPTVIQLTGIKSVFNSCDKSTPPQTQNNNTVTLEQIYKRCRASATLDKKEIKITIDNVSYSGTLIDITQQNTEYDGTLVYDMSILGIRLGA